MKSLRLCIDGVGNSKIESLPLPFLTFGATATSDDQARNAPAEVAGQYRSVRTSRHVDGSVQPSLSASTRYLSFIASGIVEVATPDMIATLRPGDVLFVDDAGASGHVMTYRGDCQIVHIDVADEWIPLGTVAPVLDDDQRDATTPAKVTEMFVTDGQAQFRPLAELFPADAASSDPRPVSAVSFMALSPDSFGDWHTEPASSLVLVTAGGFELEVGGAGGHVEVFRAGDVCLVQDRYGQGHISRTHGETRFIAVRVPDDSLWTPPALG